MLVKGVPGVSVPSTQCRDIGSAQNEHSSAIDIANVFLIAFAARAMGGCASERDYQLPGAEWRTYTSVNYTINVSDNSFSLASLFTRADADILYRRGRWKQISMKFESKYNIFHKNKFISKCYLQNGLRLI